MKILRMTAALLILIFSLTACGNSYQSYSQDFFEAFDTIITVVGHTKTKEEYDALYDQAKSRLIELSKLYDIYTDYDGITNIKTINDQAGIAPVTVSKDIIDLLELSVGWYDETDGKVNIAFGSVLKIWKSYRDAASEDPINPKIPTEEELQAANAHTDIHAIVIDQANSTVFITDPQMSIDVGAVAKGYAVEAVTDALQQAGYTSFAISAGGNVKVIGQPVANARELWAIGVQNPEPVATADTAVGTVGILHVKDTSVVTSGGYQRYFISGSKMYHHLIDPDTLMPADYYRSVTIVSPDSGLCDLLSTAIFLMPYDTALDFLKKYNNVEVLFVMSDGEIRMTDGLKDIFTHTE